MRARPVAVRRSSSKDKKPLCYRKLLAEMLEDRCMLSASNLLGGLGHADLGVGGGAPVSAAVRANQGPTITNAAAAVLNSAGTSASLSVLGSDATSLTYTWSVSSEPGGATASFSANASGAAKASTVSFNEAGSYALSVHIVDQSGYWVNSSVTVVVNQQISSIGMNPALAQVSISGSSTQFAVSGLDQFGKTMAVQSACTWSTTAEPTGGTATYHTSGQTTTVNFAKAGSYTVTAKMTDSAGHSATHSVSVLVNQQLAGMTMSPAATQVIIGGTSTQFVAQALDQFGNSMALLSALTWSATSLPSGATTPTYSTNGLATTVTFNKIGTYQLTARLTDSHGNVVTRSETVVVNPTLTTIAVSPVTSTLSAGSTEQFTAQGFDQFHNVMGTQPSISWTTSSGAISSTGLLTAPSKAGTATVVAHNGAVTGSATVTVVVAQHLTSLNINPSASQVVIAGTSTQFAVEGLDQFGNLLTTQPAITWTTTMLPSGATAPTYSTSGQTTTITFSHAGTYALTARMVDSGGYVATRAETVIVNPTLTTIAVSPGTASLSTSTTQQFTAQGLDQFHTALATQPSFTWTASSGTISSAGVLTTPATAASITITAHSSSLSAAASVTVTAPNNNNNNNNNNNVALKLNDPKLATLVASLDADGSINRADMITILQTAAAEAPTLSATDIADLKNIVADAVALNMPNYVQVLATDVVDGNAANASYQGTALGNLAAGATTANFTKLIDKWFYGTDVPAAPGYTYRAASGTLFGASGPVYTDAYQGELGDCYFISSLGSIAESCPAAIQNMFINNGDGTWTVRFYAGTFGETYNSDGSDTVGFSGTPTADYVTVNAMLPTDSSGKLVFQGYGHAASSSSNVLWMALAEKAYAQWDQTGNEWRSPAQNTYSGMAGGWMSDVYPQILGHGANDYAMTASTQQTMINALKAGEAVTIATDGFSGTTYGLFGSHAYAVTGYNSSTNTFSLYNPWGMPQYQPGALSWSQLENACCGFTVTAGTGTVPISSLKAQTVVAAAAPVKAASEATPLSSAATADTAANDSALADFSSATGSDGAAMWEIEVSTAAHVASASAEVGAVRACFDGAADQALALTAATAAAPSDAWNGLSASLVDATFQDAGLSSESGGPAEGASD